MKRELKDKVQLLLRSEKALFKLEMQRRSRQIILVVIASIAILAAIVMINISSYLYLNEKLTSLHSAIILSVANVLLSLLMLWLASRQELGKEAESMYEIRNFAMQELSEEFGEIGQEAVEMRAGFSQVSKGVSSLFNRDFSALKALVPLIEMFVKSRKKA